MSRRKSPGKPGPPQGSDKSVFYLKAFIRGDRKTTKGRQPEGEEFREEHAERPTSTPLTRLGRLRARSGYIWAQGCWGYPGKCSTFRRIPAGDSVDTGLPITIFELPTSNFELRTSTFHLSGSRFQIIPHCSVLFPTSSFQPPVFWWFWEPCSRRFLPKLQFVHRL